MYYLLHPFSKIAAVLFMLAMLAMPVQVLGQNYENFDNLTLGSTPGDGSFLGNSLPWYYINCRGDVPINGKAITLGVGAASSSLTCFGMPEGIQVISFDLMQVGPNPATVYVYVDDQHVMGLTTSVEGLVVNSGPISFSTGGGTNVKVEFFTLQGGNEVTLDNISWAEPYTPDNLETFDNLNTPGYFDDGSFIGQNGLEWSYFGMEGTLDGPAITLGEYGSLDCEDIVNGIYSLNFDYVQNTSQAVNLDVYINWDYFTSISSDAFDQLMNSGELIVDIPGDGSEPVYFTIENAGGEVTIDNIAWTNRDYDYTEFTGTGNWSDPARWSSGIPDENYYAFIEGEAIIDVAASAHYVGIEPQRTLTISGGDLTAETLTIRADATGSGSFIGSASDLNIVYAFMHWHITSGVSNAWHLLSSPVPNQGLTGYSTQFAPPSSGYDFYAWDEPTEMWLNRKVPANNINSFIPGKGYLVAYEDISADKFFGDYTFNSGTITIPVTAPPGIAGKSPKGIYAGFNLIGNPYPSSVDWKSAALDKNVLNYDNNGYTMYIWNDAVNNYGAYNDATAGDAGTNGVGRYIPALQGFFVLAQSDGNFVFNDGARVHNTQLNMKSGNEMGFRLSVTAPENAGKDEILLDFGHESNEGGADKWYSMNATAPALYAPTEEKEYSIRFLTNIADNLMVPIAFKAGIDGEYSIQGDFNTAAFSSVKLMDEIAGTIHDLNSSTKYTFTATTDDDVNRFNLIFGTLGIDEAGVENGVHVYAFSDILYVETTSKEVALVNVINLTGQLVMQGKTGGDTLSTFNASVLSNGVYVVNVISNQGVVSQKVVLRK